MSTDCSETAASTGSFLISSFLAIEEESLVNSAFGLSVIFSLGIGAFYVLFQTSESDGISFS